MDPFTIFLLSTLIGTGTQVVGGMMQNSANKEAAAKSEAVNNRMLTEQERQNRFGERLSKEQLGLEKQNLGLAKSRFAQDTMVQNYGISQDQLKRVTDIMNNNQSLANNVLQKWSI
jgi:hypothetical protein